MNKIYIINNNFDFEINLNFKNNTFEILNKIIEPSIEENTLKEVDNYFEIIDKDKIKLTRSNNITEIYYTIDSYLYYSNFDLQRKISKIFLINSEWNDQALLNFDTNILKRIKNNEQHGNFIFEIDKIIINWNYWGTEIYIKYDEYTYIKENYMEENQLLVNSSLNPIHIFIHIALINDWKDILLDQIETIKNSGLYDKCEKIHLGILGNISTFRNEILEYEIFNDIKFNILYVDNRLNLYEIHTINHIKSFCDTNIDDEIYILYIHTKGVRKAGNENVTKSWRKMMEYFLIEKYNNCIENLHYFDTIGNNIVNLYCTNKDEISINNNHTYHYSGNFWWSKKSYINKLNYIPLDLTNNSNLTRYRAENWILSHFPDTKIGFILQDDTNTHPYHRYVFEYYKGFNILIKKKSL